MHGDEQEEKGQGMRSSMAGTGALLCPYEWEDPAFRRSGRLPNLRYGDQVRAVWVTRYDFHSEQDIVRIMQRSAQAGFNTVFFQVRGNASTYYPSRLEPWSEAYGWKHPGFDPLQLAIGEAHAKGMALHAWINVMPLWRGTEPPTNPAHLYLSRPEWSWYDAAGRRQPLNCGFYVSLNPCLPEARSHIVEVCREIVSQYSIDGLHLDYIRFPNEKPVVKGGQYSRDGRTLELFQAETGLASPDERPQVWDRWRCDCVTALLREIRRTSRSLRPQLVLTAAVGAERKQALSKFQDVERWWKERLLDAVVPMNYTACPRTFRIRVEHEWEEHMAKLPATRNSSRLKKKRQKLKERKWREGDGYGRGRYVDDGHVQEWCRPPEPAIIMGTSLEFGDTRLHQKQLALALQRFGHFSVFCYSSLFGLGRDRRAVDMKRGSSLSLLPFLKILADASLLLMRSHVGHPFRAPNFSAHPEEAFPYDQLHLYNHVPSLHIASGGQQQQQPGRMKHVAARARARAKDVVKLNNRRTFRRGLHERQRRKDSYLARMQRGRPSVSEMHGKQQQEGSRGGEVLVDDRGLGESPLAMQNWEAVKMSEATAGVGHGKGGGTDMVASQKHHSQPASRGHVLNQKLHKVIAAKSFQVHPEHPSAATGSLMVVSLLPKMGYQGSRPMDTSAFCCISATQKKSCQPFQRVLWGIKDLAATNFVTVLRSSHQFLLHLNGGRGTARTTEQVGSIGCTRK